MDSMRMQWKATVELADVFICYLSIAPRLTALHDMIASRFILNILDILLNGDEFGTAIRPQIPFLPDAEYDYTGVGVFVTFYCDKGIDKYEMTGEKRIVLDGVTITSPELKIGASAILFINEGVVDFLEIWSH